MQESYGEGLASHTGPESWVVVRKDGDEALTGVRAGRVLNREMRKPPQGGYSGVLTHIRECGKATSTASLARDAAGPALRTRLLPACSVCVAVIGGWWLVERLR